MNDYFMKKENQLKEEIVKQFGQFGDLVKVTPLNKNKILVSLPLWMRDGDNVSFYLLADKKGNIKIINDGDLINVHCSLNPKIQKIIKDFLIRKGFEVDDQYSVSYNTNRDNLVSSIFLFANTMVEISYFRK